MRVLSVDDSDKVSGTGIVAVPIYYGAVAVAQAAPAIAAAVAKAAAFGAGLAFAYWHDSRTNQ